MHKIWYKYFLFSTLLLLTSCSNNPATSNDFVKGKVTDIDGNVYQTVKIGNQWWMAENLRVTHYRNGKAILKVTDNTSLVRMGNAAYCVYDNDDSNANTYGLLYNWYAVDDSNNIAPSGWHVATDEEWKELEVHLGMSQNEVDYPGPRGTAIGLKLKETGTTHWNSPNSGATNESGFTALPGGIRFWYDGQFMGINTSGMWWTATEATFVFSWYRQLGYNYSEVFRGNTNKTDYFSVRCIKD